MPSSCLLAVAAAAARIFPQPLKRAIYQIEPLARLVRGLLNRAAPPGLAHVSVAAGDLQGFTLALDMHKEKDYWLGTYEPHLQAAIRRFVQPGMTAYDVGANIGYISLLLARAVGEEGQVFSFEALPTNLIRLRRNISLNHMGGRVTVLAGAVTDRPGKVRFLVHGSTSMGKAVGSAGRKEEDYDKEIAVPGIVLDDFVYVQDSPPPQIIKMDIEGGEVLAIQGMQSLLAEHRPLMLVELHGFEAAQVVWDTLRAQGYRLHLMTGEFPEVYSVQELDWKAYVIGIPPLSLEGVKK